MIAKASLFNEFMSVAKVQFVVPVYQRHYVWGINECELLFKDILEIGSNEKPHHFIGSIVYVTEAVTTTDIKEFVIVDGQQRLTTMMLIYLALHRWYKTTDDKEKETEVYELYLINKFSKNEEKRIKLKPTENNEEALKHIFDNEDYKNRSNLTDNFNYFMNQITEDSCPLIENGLKKLMFIEMILNKNEDDPQRIFESLNSTGVDLSEADLIRNYILMNLNIDGQNKIYKNYWGKIEDLAKEDNNNESKVSDFIRDYITMTNKTITNQNKVYDTFKKIYPFKTIAKIEEILIPIKESALFYNKLLNPQNEKDEDIRKELSNIKLMEVNVAYPFLMNVYKDYTDEKIDKQTFIDILHLLQSYVWRRFILDLSRNLLNRIFASLYSKIDHNNYLYSLQLHLLMLTSTDRFPNDEDVEKALKEKDIYRMKTKSKTYLFQKLENYSKEKIDIQLSKVTIEHIFPQNPHRDWRNLLSNEEYTIINDKYLHTISNLTLLDNNSSLGNKTFNEKKEEGYNPSKLWLNSFLKEVDEWNTENLDKRFEKIKERFFNIWQHPDIEIPEKEKSIEVDIFDSEDPTHKKLEYAIFFEKEIQIDTITSLYSIVMETLFTDYKDKFFNFEITELLKLEKNKKLLRDPLAVGNNYFIEANLSSKEKFNKIKQTLKILNLDDKLSIVYKEN